MFASSMSSKPLTLGLKQPQEAVKLRLHGLPEDILILIGEHMSPRTASKAVLTCRRLHQIWGRIPSSQLLLFDVLSNVTVSSSRPPVKNPECRSIHESSSLVKSSPTKLILELDFCKYAPSMSCYSSLTNHLNCYAQALRSIHLICRNIGIAFKNELCALITAIACTMHRNPAIKLHLQINSTEFSIIPQIAAYGLEALPRISTLRTVNFDIGKFTHRIELLDELTVNSDQAYTFPLHARRIRVCNKSPTFVCQSISAVCEELLLKNISGARSMFSSSAGSIVTNAQQITVSNVSDVSIDAERANIVWITSCSKLRWGKTSPARTLVYLSPPLASSSPGEITLETARSLVIAYHKKHLDFILTLAAKIPDVPLLQEILVCHISDVHASILFLRSLISKAPQLKRVHVTFPDVKSAKDAVLVTGLLEPVDGYRLTNCPDCRKPSCTLSLMFDNLKQRELAMGSTEAPNTDISQDFQKLSM